MNCQFCGAPRPEDKRPHLSNSECIDYLRRRCKALEAENEKLRGQLAALTAPANRFELLPVDGSADPMEDC